MKAFLGAAILAVTIVGAVIWRAVGVSSAQRDLQSRLLADSGAALENLGARLKELEERLGALETQALQQPRAAVGLDDRAVTPTAAASSGEPATSEAKTAKAVASGPYITGMSEENLQELRALIADVYVQERSQRRQREKEAAEQAAREQAALSQGPYGDHNYRVNSLGKRLGLSDYQKSRYHDTLVAHRQRLKDAQVGLNLSDAASREAWKDRRRVFEDDFQSTVITLLSPEQAEAYADLGAEEKMGGDGMHRFDRIVRFGAQGDVEMEVFKGGEGHVEIAVPATEAVEEIKPRVIQVKPAQ